MMSDTEALVAKLEELDTAVRRVLRRGESAGDDRLVLLAVREGRANVDVLARIGVVGELERRGQVLAEEQGHGNAP